MAETLLVSAAASVVAAGLYLYLARVLHRRQVSPQSRLAKNLFALFWFLLGALSLLGVLQIALYRAGQLPIWLYSTLGQLGLMVLFGALWALQAYLTYLYSGSKRWLVPLGAFYLALYVCFVGLIQLIGPPDSLIDDGWRLQTEPEVHFARGITVAFILLLLGPQLAGAIAYARLYRKVTDPTQRYRIAMLTGSILVWFGTSAVVGAASDPDSAGDNLAWQVVSRLLSIAAPLVILAAYRPPAWIRRRYGIRSLDHESMPVPQDPRGSPPSQPT